MFSGVFGDLRPTPDPDHLPLPPLIPLDERHDNGCSKVSEAGCDCAHDGNVAVAGKFWGLGVIFLEHAKGEWKSCIVQNFCEPHGSSDGQSAMCVLPHSNASNAKAAQRSLQAADPPSTGASSCSARPPFDGSPPSSSCDGWRVLSVAATEADGRRADRGAAIAVSSVPLITNLQETRTEERSKSGSRVTFDKFKLLFS